jgi:hypothetical protein
MSQEINLLNHLTNTDEQVLRNRSKLFVSKLDNECYNKFFSARNKLEEKLNQRESLLDFGRKNAHDLTLSKSYSDIPSLSTSLMDLNNEINLLFISLKYQKDVLVQLFGDDAKYTLPDINKVI